MGLNSVHNRHRTRSLTDSRKARGDGYPNLVRGQSFDAPGMAVCSDITYLKSAEGWLYLCTVKDIVSGEILGEATAENMKADLVIRAFLNAQARHRGWRRGRYSIQTAAANTRQRALATR